jgi:hypothetical protein
MEHNSKFSQDQLNKTLRLYRYHKKRLYYQSFLSGLIPEGLYQSFLHKYKVENASIFHFFFALLKSIMFGTIFFFIFKFINLNDITNVFWTHLFFLVLYISSAAYQISLKAEAHKNDFLMLILGDLKIQLLKIEIKKQLLQGYLSVVIPITITTLIRIAIHENFLIIILIYLIWQLMCFIIAKFVILIVYHSKYQLFRHSFFRDALVGFMLFLMSIVIFAAFHIPVLFLNLENMTIWTYTFIFVYMILIILIGQFFFNKLLKSYLNKRLYQMIYPKKNSQIKQKVTKGLALDSPLLYGLSRIEKEIAIKDIKMFRRANKKEYYAALFSGFGFIFIAITSLLSSQEVEDLLSAFAQLLIYLGSAFMFHMISTAFLKPHLSYAAEGSNTKIYQRLNISKKEIYRVKYRIFNLMSMPISIIFLLSLSVTLVNLSIFDFILLIFAILYYLGLSQLKLKQFLIQDIYESRPQYFDTRLYSPQAGNVFVIGLFFMIAVPIMVVLMLQVLIGLLGEMAIFMVMLSIITIISILFFAQIKYINQKLANSQENYND